MRRGGWGHASILSVMPNTAPDSMGFDSKHDFAPPTVLPGVLLCLGCGVSFLGGIQHSQDHPQEKKCKKAKWLSEEALQILRKEENLQAKEKRKNTHLNAEFWRITRRDKKAFLSDQCKETEEKNRMGKTRDLFKKIRDTKGIFHAKMGSIKDRNGMDLTEAEEEVARIHRRTVQKRSSWPR